MPVKTLQGSVDLRGSQIKFGGVTVLAISTSTDEDIRFVLTTTGTNHLLEVHVVTPGITETARIELFDGDPGAGGTLIGETSQGLYPLALPDDGLLFEGGRRMTGDLYVRLSSNSAANVSAYVNVKWANVP